MRALLLTATLTQTAALGVTGRADHRHDTYDHVPGSVLRGALAACWLRTPGAPGPDDGAFREVFEGDGSFGPLHSSTSLPVPLSAHVHKAGLDAPCGTPWWDAVDGLVPEVCPKCRPSSAKLEPSKGQPTGPAAISSRSRVAIGADGLAEDGRLFRRAALDRGTVLTGWVSGPAVDALTPGGTAVSRLRFGGERSIRGTADIQVSEAAPPPVRAEGRTVILRLSSPGVFVDRTGHPTDKPSKPELADLLDVKIADVRAWTRWTEVGGWHMASGLPKPRDRAVTAGSTYRIECAAPPAPERLAALAARGIGLRRREGFGALYGLPVADDRNAAYAVIRTAVAALWGWSKWPRIEPIVREASAWPIPSGHLLRRVPSDPSLTRDQLAALLALVDIDDPAIIARLLDDLRQR